MQNLMNLSFVFCTNNFLINYCWINVLPLTACHGSNLLLLKSAMAYYKYSQILSRNNYTAIVASLPWKIWNRGE